MSALENILTILKGLSDKVDSLEARLNTVAIEFPDEMTTKQAALFLNCSTKRIERLGARGELTPIRDGRYVRWPKKELERYKKRHAA